MVWLSGLCGPIGGELRGKFDSMRGEVNIERKNCLCGRDI